MNVLWFILGEILGAAFGGAYMRNLADDCNEEWYEYTKKLIDRHYHQMDKLISDYEEELDNVRRGEE
jgi:ATP-dependent Zn protease